MIDMLNSWMLESSRNFNIIVAITAAIYISSLTVLFYIGKKFGMPDERNSAIYLKIFSRMFITQLITNSIFISWIGSDVEFFRQFLILFQGIALLVGAIYAVKFYRRDFK